MEEVRLKEGKVEEEWRIEEKVKEAIEKMKEGKEMPRYLNINLTMTS